MPQNVRTITRDTLADALTTLRWDIKRHGSLLCIAPEKTALVMPGPPMEGFGIGAEWLSQQNKLAHERLGAPIPLFYPYDEPEPRKNHEAQWVIAPEKWTDKTPGDAVLDLRAVRMVDLLAGLRRGEF